MGTTGHELICGIVYGPVISRRFGKTLGINLLPSGDKFCNFNCPYCQLGLTHNRSDAEWDFPRVAQIAGDVHDWLKINSPKGLRAVVISGNGEPTLHPAFAEITEVLMGIRESEAPRLPIYCFTNGTRFSDIHVLKALSRLDQCHLKLDPGSRISNQPLDAENRKMILARARSLQNLYIQSCVFSGKVSNTSEPDVVQWLEGLHALPVREIFLYTVSRQTAIPDIIPVEADIMQNLATRARATISCPVRVV